MNVVDKQGSVWTLWTLFELQTRFFLRNEVVLFKSDVLNVMLPPEWHSGGQIRGRAERDVSQDLHRALPVAQKSEKNIFLWFSESFWQLFSRRMSVGQSEGRFSCVDEALASDRWRKNPTFVCLLAEMCNHMFTVDLFMLAFQITDLIRFTHKVSLLCHIMISVFTCNTVENKRADSFRSLLTFWKHAE